MPIYEYRCTGCGFQKEYLQKVSDPPMSVCPSCSKATFAKMLTAAGFHLKGSGWYATDFKGGKAPKPAGDGASEVKAEGKSETKSDTGTESEMKTKTETTMDTKVRSKTESGAKTATPAVT
ncbi:MAG: zinc ribbon domain-containing protein [Betaproteobacteria bacterium]|nr:zinc ribbon domain-containing protein [Betaproteobacteria bacterium]